MLWYSGVVSIPERLFGCGMEGAKQKGMSGATTTRLRAKSDKVPADQGFFRLVELSS
jgi:hypothetical protein